MTHVAQFTVDYQQFLDHNSNLTQPLPAFAEKAENLLALYRYMVFTRSFDAKCIALQRTGKLGTFPSSLGQEAIPVAIGHAMHHDDILAPYYRDGGAYFQRGVSPLELLLFWGGNENGSNFKNNPHDFPICIPIATQCLHAAGAATAIQIKKQKRAVVTVIGDGGTSEGDFYEALNVAGTWNLPLVFVVNNNQWAISVPRDKQTGAQTIAQKAIAAGIVGEQVDGNDVIAVRNACANAVEKARNGDGPSFIEAITYRLCDHTTADDATRYRDEAAYEQAQKREPVKRLRQYLINKGCWDDSQEQALLNQYKEEINAVVEKYLATPTPAPESMFDYLYETLPDIYHEQREQLINETKGVSA